MNLRAVRHAFLSLQRSPLRSGLVVALLGVGLSFALTSFGLAKASSDRLDEIRTTVGTRGTITSNPAQRQTLLQAEVAAAQREGRNPDFAAVQSQVRPLEEADLLALGDLQYARLVDVTASTGARLADEALASALAESRSQANGGNAGAAAPSGAAGSGSTNGGPGAGVGRPGGVLAQNDVMLQGNIDLARLAPFESGARVIMDGRSYSKADADAGSQVIVIDLETATALGLEVGGMVALMTSTQVLPPENESISAGVASVRLADAPVAPGSTQLSVVGSPRQVALTPGESLFLTIDGTDYSVRLVSFDPDAGSIKVEPNAIPWAPSTVLRNSVADERRVDVEVIGIYAQVEDSTLQGFGRNVAVWYAPIGIVRALDASNTSGAISSAVFDYGSADNAGRFSEDVAARLGQGRALVVTDQAEFTDIQASIVRVSNAGKIGLVAALLVVGVIMLLLMALIVRSRVREIGILKAIGGRNGDVVSQFAVETVMLAAAAALVAGVLTLATGAALADQFKAAAGTVSATPASTPAANVPQGIQGGFASRGGLAGAGGGVFGNLQVLAQPTGATDAQVDAAIESISLAFSPALAGMGFLAALGVALVGVTVPTLTIVRMRPASVLRFDA